MISVSKVTLDIICLTAFGNLTSSWGVLVLLTHDLNPGYNTNSLENPENELALAYKELVNLQNGGLFRSEAEKQSLELLFAELSQEFGFIRDYDDHSWRSQFSSIRNGVESSWLAKEDKVHS
jgi:hypothetical protein